MREEEAGSLGKTIRKFTYKGEVEIDAADDNAIEVILHTFVTLCDLLWAPSPCNRLFRLHHCQLYYCYGLGVGSDTVQ